MSRKVCFVAVFAVSALPQVCFAASSSAAVSALPKVCFAVSSSAAAASSLSKVSFVAVFVASSSAAVSSLPKVCFAVSSSAIASSLSKVCFVAVFASAASLAFGKNRATTLAGWKTISLPKSTSFSCKTMFFVFCIYCLIGCTFGNRKMCSLQKQNKYQQILDLVLLQPQDGVLLQNWLPKFELPKKKNPLL